ncbi:MAG: hypothetical protein EOO71_20290, partial [Myxococcaceae bacterium]
MKTPHVLTSFRLLGGLLVLSLVGAGPAFGQAGGPSTVGIPSASQDYFTAAMAETARLYDDLEYEQALASVTRARRLARTEAQRSGAAIFEGIVLADMGQREAAMAAFRAGLKLTPEAKLPVKVSPKVEGDFESVRKEVQRDRSVVAVPTPVEVAPRPTDAPVQATAEAPPKLTARPVASAPVASPGVDLTVDAVDLPETTVQLAADGSVWTGLLSQLRAGTGRRFRAFAYDSNARLIYQGEATEVTITANQTVQVNILLQQVDPSPAFENAGPLITALVVSRSSVEVGGFVDVQATARDPNTGDVLTFSWTATAGSFNTPTALGSRWTAPLTEGVQTLTLMVADQLGASTSVSFPIQVEGTGVGEAEVFVRFNSWPEVIALSGFPTQVVPGQSIGVSVHATDNDDVQASLHYAWTASCAGTWTDEGSASAHFTPTELPAQNTCDNCQLTVRVTDGRGGEGLGHLGVCVGAPVSPNVAPRITSAFQTARTVGPGNTVRFNVRAVDPEGTALSFAWEAPVGSLAVPVPLGDGSEVAWTAPACVDARSTPVVRVRVTDAEGLEALQAFSLTWNGPACATTLGFLTQPTDRLATQTLAPAVQVVLMDSLGRTSLAPSGPVRLEVGANPGGATLSGTVEVAPVSGIATFADLSLNASGVGYTLVASVPGLPSAVSQAFTIHPLAIQGASLNHYLTTGNAMATQGSDLGSSVIQALVEQPNGTFMTFSGTGAVDGTFSIEGVPSGLYYLRLGTDYVVTSSRAPDLGRDGQGRPDAIPANTSTFLAVDFQGLAPWKSGDSIEVFSQGTGLWTSSVSALGPTGTSPVVGAHQWAQPLKYWQMRNAHLVDAASGDVATFHQLSRKTDGSLPAEPFTYSAASRAYSAPLAIAQGATASMSGMMSVLPQDQALMVDVRAQAFESLRTAVNPGAQAAVSHS